MGEYAPFEGFPEEGSRFFQELSVNNNREWFEAHKQEYIDYVQTPAVSFVVELGERLRPEFPGITYDTRTNGAGSVMRIYRDIRFSKDKTPYKTHIGVNLWEGPQKKGSPGFHFWMDAESAAMYGGYHVFPKEFLPAYREAVDDEKTGKELEQALDDLSKIKGYEFGGEQLKRVPPGYDKDHPRGDLLKYKGLFVRAPEVSHKTLKSPNLIEVCAEHAHVIGPVHRWFVKVDRSLVH